MQQYVGEIASDASGNNTYTSPKYGISFTYPKGWHIDSNSLGYGTLRLINFDVRANEQRDFAPGQNKIEVNIDTHPSVEYSPDYPNEKHEITRVEIGGIRTVRTVVFLSEGLEFLNYIIPIPALKEKYLTMSMWGDSANFYVLDQVARSIKFSK
jgi:hypothetical protein